MSKTPPIYNLDDVRAAAANESKIILAKGADRDRLGLDYTISDVSQCIQALLPSDYRKSHVYDDDANQAFDDYVTKFQHREQEVEDEIYIKLKLTPKSKVLIISFHQEGRWF